jgi:hypothetical protein
MIYMLKGHLIFVPYAHQKAMHHDYSKAYNYSRAAKLTVDMF